jgi:hypothetical protein
MRTEDDGSLILAKPRGNAAQKLTAAAMRGKARVPRALMGALGGTNQFAGREVRILRVDQKTGRIPLVVCTENLTWGFPSQGAKNH